METKKTNYIISYHTPDNDEKYDWQSLLRSVYATGRYSTITGQLERGIKKNKVHVQAFVRCIKQLRGKQVIRDFPEGTWFKKTNKFQIDPANTGFRMQEYCKKEDTRISEGYLQIGDPIRETNNSINGKKGRQTQLERYETAYECAVKGEWETIDKELYIKHYTTFKRVHVAEKTSRLERGELGYEIRPWQQYILDGLTKPDGRTVYWVYDQYGAVGKTIFAAWYSQDPSCFYLQGGDKKQDVLFQITERHTHLLVDIPRCSMYKPYQLIEIFLGGHWRSSKYEGNYVYRKSPGVAVVFANKLPSVLSLTLGRWRIISVCKDFSFTCIDPIDIINELEVI